jgi:hypothetical protein
MSLVAKKKSRQHIIKILVNIVIGSETQQPRQTTESNEPLNAERLINTLRNEPFKN